MSNAAAELEKMASEFRALAGKVRDQVPSARIPELTVALSTRAEVFDAAAERLTSRAFELRAAHVPPTSGYEIAAEIMVRGSGTGMRSICTGAWIDSELLAKTTHVFDIDPGGKPGKSRWCETTTTGGIELRDCDRVVVLRPTMKAAHAPDGGVFVVVDPPPHIASPKSVAVMDSSGQIIYQEGEPPTDGHQPLPKPERVEVGQMWCRHNKSHRVTHVHRNGRVVHAYLEYWDAPIDATKLLTQADWIYLGSDAPTGGG